MTHPAEVLPNTTLELSGAELELLSARLLAMEEAADITTEQIKLSEGVGGASPHGGGT